MKRWIAACALLVAACMALGCALAEEPAQRIGFAVRPVLPENQVDDVGYFYLMMHPAEQQTLMIEVINRNDEELAVALRAVDATTNERGEIAYVDGAVPDGLRFTDLVIIEEPSCIVPGGGSAMVQAQIEMPEQPYDGEMLGGLVIAKQPDAQNGEAQAGGIRIENRYEYLVAVRLREDEVLLEPDFALLDARMDTERGVRALVLDIKNGRALVIKGLSIHVELWQEGGDSAALAYDKANASMAPDSTMALRIGEKELGALNEGRYQVRVRADYQGEVHVMEAAVDIAHE